MLPPCDPTILENNSQFKRLYQNLTTNLLNPDGSTRTNDLQPARREVREVLNECRLRHAKRHIKRQILRQLAFDPDSGVPDDYRETAAIITLYLESSPTQLDSDVDPRDGADALSLLGPDIDAFYADLPILMPSFANALSATVQDLRAIVNAGDSHARAPPPPSETSRARARNRQSMIRAAAQAPLAPQISDRTRHVRRMQLSEIPASRARLATTAAEVLAAKAQVLERAVVLLERTKHGAVARATKAKAEHLAMVAEGVDGKLSVMQLETSAAINTPEIVTALGRYQEHLKETRERVERQKARLLEELDGYQTADTESGPIKEIARRYGGLIKEMEGVRMEIERLREK
ncbi:hypothetical protein P168DRAFT_289286 [Aspergillus campestris IBT 28561]|uniref:Uncharacterized protein n=1 Tax=Aspergillus campestris (strain IBT 28561) TaxID=1392248 RepID=A0A2I1D7P5_ASPC2|nr:uncharacterized protein P168DRAFT_289286 [Aspergillus campestris IBT 28561]PKY05878.1 hypothetical protein P168DRAFT_289286 [Aspergillus campestris IBT 28561]